MDDAKREVVGGASVMLSTSDWQEVIAELETARSRALEVADGYAKHLPRRADRYRREADALSGLIDRIAGQLEEDSCD